MTDTGSAASTPARVWLTIPAFNPGPALEAFLAELLPHLGEIAGCAVQLVDDGSRAREAERIQNTYAAYAKRHAALRGPIVLPKNSGKGAAIRAGWSAAPESAQWLAFVDADGSVPARELVRVCELARGRDAEVDAWITSRRSAGRTVQRRGWRRGLSAVFAAWVRRVLGLPYADPQCGLKLVRADAFRRIEPWLRETRFSFDVELLALLQHFGFRVREEAIDWSERGPSTVHWLRDGAAMGWSVVRIRIRLSAWRES